MISIERKQSRKKTRAPRRASGFVFLLSHFFVYEISFPGNRFNSISMEIRRENLQYWINNFVACGRACMQHNIHGQMELSMDTVVRPNVSGKKTTTKKVTLLLWWLLAIRPEIGARCVLCKHTFPSMAGYLFFSSSSIVLLSSLVVCGN